MSGVIPERLFNNRNIEGGEPRSMLESPYRNAGSLLNTDDRVQKIVQTSRPTILYTRVKRHHALRVRDIPVMIGGGVFGMVAGEALGASIVTQWALIGFGIIFGIIISIVEWVKKPMRATD
jgi:hypothetical protein